MMLFFATGSPSQGKNSFAERKKCLTDILLCQFQKNMKNKPQIFHLPFKLLWLCNESEVI